MLKRKVLIGIILAAALLGAGSLLLWRSEPQFDLAEASGDRATSPVADGDDMPPSASPTTSREPAAHRSKLALEGGDLEGAEDSGEPIGGYGTRTTEELLFNVTELRAEPFAPLVLDKLADWFKRLESPADRVRAAAVLHRHARAAGTEYLREQLSLLGATGEAFPIASTLAMARDEQSLQHLVDGLAQFASDPEFVRAAGAWAHPAIVEKARRLLGEPTAPRGNLAIMLAMARDQAAAPLLKELAAKTPPQNPFHHTYQAALARLGHAPAEYLLENMGQIAANPTRVLAFLTDSALLLGPELAAPFVSKLVNDFSIRRRAFGTEYDEHAVGMRDGVRSVSQLPTYPMMEERRMLEAVSILKEWKAPSSAEPIYQALEASQSGRYSVLMNRRLMAATVQIDPVRSSDRLREMGLPEEEIAAAAQLAKLSPVANAFMPRQRSIVITKQVIPHSGD